MDPALVANLSGQDQPLIGGVPPIALAAALVALVAGLVLWVAGGKILKPMLALLGFAGGGLTGAVLAANLWPAPVAGVQSGYVGFAIGAGLGALLSVALFRFAMAAGGGIVFACAAALTTGVVLAQNPQALPLDAAQTRDAASRVITTSLSAQTPPTARDTASAIGSEGGGLWRTLPEPSRVALIGATLVGGLLGVGIGALAPRRAAAIVSAWLGAVVWLASFAFLASTLNVPGRQFFDLGPGAWLALWLVVALVGVTIQLSGRDAPKPAA